MTRHRVRVGRGHVAFESAGTGEPLVLLHGFPHDRTLWAPQLAAPIDGVRTFAPDLPGFGESSRAGEASVERWADWLAALLDHLQLERVMLGGLSMGGYLCFAFWRRHPQRVRALILADMLPGMVGRTTRDSRPDVVAALDAMMRRQSMPAIVDALTLLRERPDSTPTLATISVPTLVLCGEEDALTPVKESEAMASAIPGSRLAILPRAGHASNLEEPAAFTRLLSGFASATIRG
jgi:3-oxoadipate enol-lactonase